MEKTAAFGKRNGSLVTENELELFAALLTTRHGLIFAPSQTRRLASGIGERVRANALSSVEAYLPLLEADQNEQQQLIDLVTNTLSRFFRNRDQLRTLSQYILPALCEDSGAEPLRLWSAGCSTGEEAYTLAMLVHDAGPSHGYAITATDINHRALTVARRARYAERRLAEIPPEFRARYVEAGSTGPRIAATLQTHVTFADHNVCTAPLVTNQDVVFCRNVLTYLSEGARRRAVEVIHESLRPGGYLIIGNSESLNGAASRLQSVRTTWARVYRRR